MIASNSRLAVEQAKNEMMQRMDNFQRRGHFGRRGLRQHINYENISSRVQVVKQMYNSYGVVR